MMKSILIIQCLIKGLLDLDLVFLTRLVGWRSLIIPVSQAKN